MYKLIYEASGISIITVPFVIICIFGGFMLFYTIYTWRGNEIFGRVGMSIVSLVLLIIIFSTIFGHVEAKSLYDEYSSGEYLMTEGVISNYEIGFYEKEAYPDRFIINEIPFVISNAPQSGYGYTLRQTDGGVLRDGVICKIHYIPYKNENVIMALYIVESTD